MPEVTRYRRGVPNWVDVSSSDLPTAIAFYEALFGWTAEDQGPEAGHYHMFRLRGLDVAGIGPAQDGAPQLWSTYVAVDDADAAVAAVAASGGVVVLPPMDVLASGRMSFAIDPAGAAFGIWQGRDHIGSRIVNEPNAPVWHELASRDLATAMSFYGAVLGWRFQSMEGPFPYQLVKVDGRTVAGAMQMEGEAWGDLPSHWMVYFAVDDTDDAARRCRELGGSVSVEPFDVPIGRCAVLNDPTGPAFSVVALRDIDDPNAGWT